MQERNKDQRIPGEVDKNRAFPPCRHIFSSGAKKNASQVLASNQNLSLGSSP